MNKILKKFLAVFIAVMMSFTSIGFSDTISNENNMNKDSQLLKATGFNNDDVGSFFDSEGITTTGSIPKVEINQQDFSSGATPDKQPIVSLENMLEETPFEFDSENGIINGYKGGEPPENLIIPQTINGVQVRGIGTKAFYYSDRNTKIKTKLKSIEFPEGLEFIGEWAFQGNLIENIVLPDTVKRVEERGFWGNSISTIKFSENLTFIGKSAFERNRLTNLQIPSNVEIIEDSAFKDNILKEIKLPEGLKQIGPQVFTFNALSEVIIPETVENLPTKSNRTFWRSNTKQEDKLQRFTKIYNENGYVNDENTQGILNPASVTINYESENGEELKAPTTVVGRELKTIIGGKLEDGMNIYISDYLTPSNNYKDYNFMKELSANYFRTGNEYEFEPEEIAGYLIPDKVKLKLEKENTVKFIYPSAGSKKLILSGEGLSSSESPGNVGVNAQVKVVIIPPFGKTIDSLKVNGIEKKSEIQYKELEYSYSFKMQEDMNIEVSYKNDEIIYDKDLKLEISKSEIKLGEKTNIKAFYRGQAVDVNSSGVTWTAKPQDIAVIDSKTGEVRALKSGTVILSGMLKNRPETVQSLELKINPFMATVRVEANNRTIASPEETFITDLDLSEYGISTKFIEPKTIHAIIKRLENAGVNVKDNVKGFSHGYGSNITMIDGVETGSTSALDGWMYYVNNTYANAGIDSYPINDGQSIVVFFQEDYSNNAFSWFDKEDAIVKTNQKLELKLSGSRYDMNDDKVITELVENANILVNNVVYTIDGKYLKTDKNGNFNILFTEPGTYYITAEKKNAAGKRVITRPYCKVIVEQGEIEGVDKSKLLNLVNEVESLITKAKIGTEPGEYAQEAVNKLRELLKGAGLKLKDDKLVLKELNDEIVKLEKGILDFKNSVNKDANLQEVINEVSGYYAGKDKYDFITSMGLRKAGIDTDVLSSKVNIYGMEGLHNTSRNVINIVAIGQNPKEYKNKDYTSFLKNYDYSNERNSQYIAKSIIAMDMSAVDYDKEKLINLLLTQGKNQGVDKIAFGSESSGYYDDMDEEGVDGDFIFSVEDSLWVMIALSNHKDNAQVPSTIEGIKKYIKGNQGTDGLVGNSSNTALLIQGLIALGEDSSSEYWSQENSGNRISLLEGLLSCRKGNQFMMVTNSGMGSEISTSNALAAMTDLLNGQSMFREFKHEDLGQPVKLNITNVEDVYIGAKFDLEVKAYDKNSKVVKDAAVELETSDPHIMKIQDGKLIALAEGTAKITAYIADDKNINSEITINVVIPPKIDCSEELKKEIGFLKEHYQAYNSFEFLASSASILAGINQETVANKIYPSSNTTALQNAKTIISLVGAKLNPKDATLKGEKIDFVARMLNSQVKDGENKGKFIFNESMDSKSILAQGYSIIAMDLVNADYDRESAVDALLQMLNSSNYMTDTSYVNIKTEAVAATALAKHKDIKGVEEKINDLIEFLRANQNEDGGFNLTAGSTFINSPIATGAVVQALLANDIDPLSWQWCKGEKTIIDGLLKSKFIGSDASRSGFSQGEGLDFENTKASQYAFGALVSISLNKSIYDLMKIEDTKPPEVEQIKIKFQVQGISKEIIASKEIKIKDELSAMEVLKQELNQFNITYSLKDSAYGAYLTEINGEEAGTLGGWDGWMYEVNGKSPEVGADSYKVKSGDTVRFYYSRWPNIETNINVEEGQQNPNVKVTIKGDTFEDSSLEKENWIVSLENTNLKLNSITKVDNQSIEISFLGKAEVGILSIQAKAKALTGNQESNIIGIEIMEKDAKDKDEIRVISKSEKEVIIKLDEKSENKITLSFEDELLPKIEADRGSTFLSIAQGTAVLTENWDRQMYIPQMKSLEDEAIKEKINTDLPSNKQLEAITARISVGADSSIKFNKHVKLVFKGQIGKESGFIDTTGKFNLIKKYVDSSERDDEVYAYDDDDNNLVIKTKHFTEFVTFTTKIIKEEIEKPVIGSSGGGSSSSENEDVSVIKTNLIITNNQAEIKLDKKMVDSMLKDAIDKNLNEMVIEPQIDSKARVNKINIVLEKESIEKISSHTKASLKLKTQIADIKLSNKALLGLAKEKGNTVTISVIANKDGSIGFEIKAGLDTVSKISSGISVSIPVEKPSSSTVAVQMMPDGSEKILMKSITEGNYLNVRMDGSATVKITENKKIYADTANHWAKDAIEFAGAREILKGTSAEKFSPNEAMTKGMLVTLLHRFENEELVQGKAYDDVKSDAYYANAAAWAQVKGIAEGETDTKFLPNQEVTREQLASMIYNYAKLSGEDVSSTNEDKIKTFEDWNETSKESQEAMKYCYNNNIIGGKSDTTLDPQGKTTRAEVSAIIQRYVSKTTI